LNFVPSAQTKEAQQHLVFFPRELLYRTICGFLQDSSGDLSFEVRRHFRVPKGFEHRSQRVHEMLHEMLDPACATTNVPLQTGAHDAPTKSRSPAHGIIRVRHTQYILFNEISDLAIKSRLKPIRVP